MDLYIETTLQVGASFSEKSTRFKNNKIIAFERMFEINAILPNYIGLGKQVSRGFGTIQEVIMD